MNSTRIMNALLSSDLARSCVELYGWDESDVKKHQEQNLHLLKEGIHYSITSLISFLRQFETDIIKTMKIIDIGCGMGLSVLNLLRLGSLDVLGIDYSPSNIELARFLKTELGLQSLNKENFFVGDACNLQDIPSETVDLVISNQVLEHVSDVISMICELHRIVRKGGFIQLYAPDYRYPIEPHYKIPWIPFLQKEKAKYWLDGFNRPISGLMSFNYISLPMIECICKDIGFEVLIAQTTVNTNFPDILSPYLRQANSQDIYKIASGLSKQNWQSWYQEVGLVLLSRKT